MEKQRIESYVEIQKPRIEKYLKYNYNNIEKITLTGINKNPMGGFSIKGYVNENKSLNFTVPASIDTDIEYVDGLANQFFDDNEKYPDKESKTVSEIEEEERNSLSFDEKMKLLNQKNS